MAVQSLKGHGATLARLLQVDEARRLAEAQGRFGGNQPAGLGEGTGSVVPSAGLEEGHFFSMDSTLLMRAGGITAEHLVLKQLGQPTARGEMEATVERLCELMDWTPMEKMTLQKEGATHTPGKQAVEIMRAASALHWLLLACTDAVKKMTTIGEFLAQTDQIQGSCWVAYMGWLHDKRQDTEIAWRKVGAV